MIAGKAFTIELCEDRASDIKDSRQKSNDRTFLSQTVALERNKDASIAYVTARKARLSETLAQIQVKLETSIGSAAACQHSLTAV